MSKKFALSFIVALLLGLMIPAITFASEAPKALSVEAFNEAGEMIRLSQGEMEFLSASLPEVSKIIAHLSKGFRTKQNLFVRFQNKEGSWHEASAGISGGLPLSEHIYRVIKD